LSAVLEAGTTAVMDAREPYDPQPAWRPAEGAGPDVRHSFTLGGTSSMTRNIGMLLLAIFLIAWGLVQLLGIGGLGVILAILAIAAGIFLLLGR